MAKGAIALCTPYKDTLSKGYTILFLMKLMLYDLIYIARKHLTQKNKFYSVRDLFRYDIFFHEEDSKVLQSRIEVNSLKTGVFEMLRPLHCFVFVCVCFSTFLSAQKLPLWIDVISPAAPMKGGETVTITPEGCILITLKRLASDNKTYECIPEYFIQVNYLDQKRENGPLDRIQWVGRNHVQVLGPNLQPITERNRFSAAPQRYIKVPIPIFTAGRPHRDKVWVEIAYKSPFVPSRVSRWRSNVAYDYNRN